MVYEFDGTKYEKLRDMQAARRAKHRAWCAAARTSPGPPTRSVCPNAPGRLGATAGHVPPARHERPLVDWYRGGMDKPKRTDAGHLCMNERIAMRQGRTARRHHGGGQSRHPRSRVYFVKLICTVGTAVVILDQEKVTRRTACTVQSSASWQSRPTSSST